jgi:hypothetical protein
LPVLLALRQWGIASFPDGGPWGSELVDRETGRPVRGLEIVAADGRPVGPEAVEFRSVPVATDD